MIKRATGTAHLPSSNCPLLSFKCHLLLGNRQVLSVTRQPPLVTGPVLLVDCRRMLHLQVKGAGAGFVSPLRTVLTSHTPSLLHALFAQL